MTHLRHLAALFLLSLVSLSPLAAQTPEELAQLEPADLFFNGWVLSRDADNLIEKEKYLDAYAKLQKAKAMYDTLAITHATYEPNLVKMRQDLTRQTMGKIYDKAEAQQEGPDKSSPFIEGEKSGNTLIKPVDRGADSNRMERLDEVQGEINALRRQLEASSNPKDANAAKRRKKLKDLEATRNDLASGPLRTELESLNNQILGLRRERDAMSLALGKTKTDLRKTQQERDFTQKALAESQRKVRDLTTTIKEQGQVSGRVVKGQQDQIDALRRDMKAMEATLAKERETRRGLEQQVEQSLALINDLQVENNDLLIEKEKMATFLKMNTTDGVQELIVQNVSLSKELNEAKRKMEAAMDNANTSKDDIVLAQRGLTVAKAKIREAQKENAQQTLRIRSLENRLKQAEDDIMARVDSGDLSELAKEELATLRETAKKQRNAIDAEKKKGELLIAQAKRMGLEDPDWKLAVAAYDNSFVPEITEEEEAVIDQIRTDFTINNRFKTSSKERLRAARELGDRKDDLNKVATKLFKKDDLEAARGVLEMIIEEDPAAWDTMINLGIIQLRANESSEAAKQFEQAILYAGDRKIPLAHLMLGDAYYRNKLFPEAEREINLSLSLDPENAQAHVLLGNMAGKQGNATEAEFHFKQAIKIDPNIWEPHFNLAYMAARAGKISKAKILYQEALRRNAPANADLEQLLDY
ncbi:tetratricopeptide repeat protein [Akkermansiaceae bacterium]|nr:tetratricopeptide repeat protein [Akkermansiaceae bacterium]MDB4411970.1 tetratricopeptide repeat protein [Akkermansiaceae bacterium]MDB4429974.1 tetratricopeptide repeat protein [Akkermansiaceae bacterium]MDB4525285.1 tetratricopeptide repeat protein [Akkermansiaceae bacterium]MDB4725307.1 tetratricopeptide repeat protein [Akkermansiaceae bacterium]